MKYLILKIIIIYYSIGTIWLMNILFNPCVKLEMVNKETKEVKQPNTFFIIGICFYWIISIPLLIIATRRNCE